MGNPFTAAGRAVKTYARNLKNAPAAQYVTRSAAESVIPDLTTMPPPAYRPAESRPVSAGSLDEVEIEKERLKAAAALTTGPLPSDKRAPKKKSGAFDFVVKAAGSRWTFLVTLLLLGLWAALGAVYGPNDTWQVIFQDISSIQCYISATLLMRQQQNSTRSLLDTICSMLSRSQGNERLIRKLSEKQLTALKRSQRAMRTDLTNALDAKEGMFDRIANAVSRFLGSLSALVIYWVGIIVWIFFGIPLMFSDTWQLYVNTATALELTFTTMFLQNVRRQHEEYLERCLASIDILDRGLEMDLRRMTGDMQPNPVVESQPPHLNRTETAIDFWAFVVGGSVGVFLSVSVFVAWISVGDFMEFDDNWWLIIGTYTGLMGFIDGFVLRNVHHRETGMADRHFAMLTQQDYRLYSLLDIPFPDEDQQTRDTKAGRRVAARISHWIGHVCEVPAASTASVIAVVALLIVASAMQWTETGQLLCNTPTMIVEGFLLLMLIEGHNSAEGKRRAQYTDILDRRLAMERRVAAWGDKWELDVEIDDASIANVLLISEKYME
ncbi:putative iron/zinc ion transporter (putative) [Sporothrix brasiliensis 5110]|uniref:Putative iron/zinc ion transporter (Putative) n=1 Tax=Sporothrix brasiliensis 5110 TaxID=1398154 RepID=A0A0C2IVP1_9PEZI|nr:putative iron/zinc ion transporter (putative) [Sporothrix brasiliensis 5110]KIH89052.1 putative iron/zinc ion transporter (putative) [Sporothrix brasiliensis 5110]